MKRDRYVLLLIPLLLALAGGGWWVFGQSPTAKDPVAAPAPGDVDETVAAHAPLVKANVPKPESAPQAVEAADPMPETAGAETRVPEQLTPPDVLLELDRAGLAGEFVLRVRLAGHVSDHLGSDAPFVEVSAGGYAVANPGDVPEGLHVEPATESFGEMQVATTASDGTFDVEVGLRLPFKDVSFAALHLRAFNGVSSSMVVNVDWTPKGQPPAVELTIAGNGGVEARVVDENGVPVEDITLYLVQLPTLGVGTPVALMRPPVTDSNGWYRIVNVAANRSYSFRIANADWGFVGNAAVVTVQPGEITVLSDEIVLRRRVLLRLEIRTGGLALVETEFAIQYTAGVEALADAVVSTDATGCLYLYDPPEGALTLSVQTTGHEALEVSLPAMFQPGINDLGSYGLTRMR